MASVELQVAVIQQGVPNVRNRILGQSVRKGVVAIERQSVDIAHGEVRLQAGIVGAAEIPAVVDRREPRIGAKERPSHQLCIASRGARGWRVDVISLEYVRGVRADVAYIPRYIVRKGVLHNQDPK